MKIKNPLKMFRKGHQNVSAGSSGGWVSVTRGIFGNTSKQPVTNDSALSLSAVYAAIRAIAEDVSKLPIDISVTDGDTRINQNDHSLHTILNFSANPLVDAMTLRDTLMAHAQGWGNGYAEIQRDAMGNPVAMWTLPPDSLVSIEKISDETLVYTFTTREGQQVKINGDDVFHLHGMGYDGLVGYNVIQYAAESIGLGIAAERFGGAFFGNGCNQSGNLKHPQHLSTEAQERLRQQIDKHHGGVEDSHRLLILEEGMEFVGNLIPPEESQFIETRKFNVNDIARWFRIPPHKIGDLERATFSNIEQQNINYVTDALDGWMKRFELEAWNKLLSESEQQQGYYVKHNANALLRGDFKARVEGYDIMLRNGVYSINEVRAFEDANPIEGGDVHLVPMNQVPVEQVGQQPQSVAEPIAENIASRIASAELSELQKRLPKQKEDPVKFKEWSDKFYEKHNKYVESQVQPLKAFKKGVKVDVAKLSLYSDMSKANGLTLDVHKKNIKRQLLGALGYV